MQVVKVKYEKPHYTRLNQFPKSEWEFSVTTDIEFPHGHNGFGGLLRRNDAGLWVARHYSSTDWATPAVQRDQAVQNLLPAAYEAIAKGKQHQRQEELQREDRRAKAEELRLKLSAHLTGFSIVIGVNDWKLGEPLRFSVEILDMSEEQVNQLAEDLRTA